MAVKTKEYQVIFPEGFDHREAREAKSKGFLADVEVRLDDGLRYRLFFIEPTRLAQDLQELAKWGKPYFSEPNLVVLVEVDAPAIQAAVAGLMAEGRLAHFKALE